MTCRLDNGRIRNANDSLKGKLKITAVSMRKRLLSVFVFARDVLCSAHVTSKKEKQFSRIYHWFRANSRGMLRVNIWPANIV